MGDFLGSYFLGTDEDQLGQDILLHGEEQPVPVVKFRDIEKDNEAVEERNKDPEEDDFRIPAADVDEDFCPVEIASMSTFEPNSMVSVLLTRKGKALFQVPGANKENEAGVENTPDISKKVATGHGKDPVESLTNAKGNSLVKSVFGRFTRPSPKSPSDTQQQEARGFNPN